MILRIHLLLAAAAAMAWAFPGGHLTISFEALRQLAPLASVRIESLEDARTYVTTSAAICGITDLTLMPEGFEDRLVAAELSAAQNPNGLVSDDQVAGAFNFMSDEFHVAHPARLTASDILQYRSVMASIFPHLFSPKSVSGSRPVGAMVMLYMLVYNGGITEGVRNAAQLDRPPGSLKVSFGTSSGHLGIDRNPNLIAGEYQTASRAYFQEHSLQDVRSFVNRLAGIMVVPNRR